MFTPSEYVDPTIFIVHIDPTADPSSEGGASSTPDLDNEAAPEYDPDLPVICTTGDPVRPPRRAATLNRYPKSPAPAPNSNLTPPTAHG